MTGATSETMTKSEFATLCRVAKSRVSHWIKDGRITGDALSGSGRSARIVVEVAQRQLKNRLDPYQMLQGGNGAKTRLDARPEPAGEQLSDDAAELMAVLLELPSTAAWEVAEPGESLQRAFDAFENLRLDAVAEMRRRGFIVDEDDFEEVDWRGLAKEIGLKFINPKTMHADWNRRRLADD